MWRGEALQKGVKLPELPTGWKVNRIAGRRFWLNSKGRWSRSWEYEVLDERGICLAVEERRNDAIAEAFKTFAERTA